jgi:RNA polymerase sigma factor (sigma-70 family)
VEHKALNILKSRARRKETNREDIPEQGGEMYSVIDDDEVTTAIRSLSPKERQAILLRFGMGYSVKETAKIMEMSYSAIQSLIWRAKGQLEKILTEKGEF